MWRWVGREDVEVCWEEGCGGVWEREDVEVCWEGGCGGVWEREDVEVCWEGGCGGVLGGRMWRFVGKGKDG